MGIVFDIHRTFWSNYYKLTVLILSNKRNIVMKK